MDLSDDVDPVRAWVAAFLTGLLGLVAAALLFTRQVYHGSLWRYFWGPVHADAEGADCMVRFPDTGQTVPGAEAEFGCTRSAYEAAAVAEPGYTVVSTLGYILVLVFMLVGVYLLLQRFDLTPLSEFFFALVPFMLFGGALRTVEDAFVAAQRAGETPAVEFPASAVLISPFIYFTVFAIALLAFLASKWLANNGVTDTYYYPLAGIGTAVLAGAFGYLLYLSMVTDYVTLHASILVLVIGIATVTAAFTYVALDRYWPIVTAGTGLMGLVVIWGHAIDGAANVIANDWTHIWNLGDYTAKHPFNRFLIDTTNSLQGGTEIAGVYVGDGWPFFVVKIIVPVLILSVFDEQFLEESPRFAVMLLGAIVAVGLGPGTRDMIRIAFGI
ncbi:hypothetical protein BRD19_06640 [Halobacteriales archaeon SW_7_65_23]|nr:MAG: hypothetical protein BRD19_06640 [Halobacteriales archaeon SW_7_65_23]